MNKAEQNIADMLREACPNGNILVNGKPVDVTSSEDQIDLLDVGTIDFEPWSELAGVSRNDMLDVFDASVNAAMIAYDVLLRPKEDLIKIASNGTDDFIGRADDLMTAFQLLNAASEMLESAYSRMLIAASAHVSSVSTS